MPLISWSKAREDEVVKQKGLRRLLLGACSRVKEHREDGSVVERGQVGIGDVESKKR